MSITRVQAATPISVTATSTTISLTGVTIGDLLVVGVETSGAATSVTVTGSRGTYTRRIGRVFQGNCLGSEVWVAIATSSGNETVTINIGSSVTIVAFFVEYAASLGWNSSLSNDGGSTGNSGTTATTFVTGNFNTTKANDLIVCIAGLQNPIISVGTGFGNFQSINSMRGFEDRLNVPPGTYQGIQFGSTLTAWQIAACAFAEKDKVASGGLPLLGVQ